jgi:hypothetical protein
MSEQAQGNLLGIAKDYDNPVFYEWFRERLGQARIQVSGIYTPHALYVDLLEQRNNVYQRWEQQEDFPVRNPTRASGITGPRLYTPQQVVAITHWFWHKNVTEKHYYGVREVTVLLGETETLVRAGLRFEGLENAAVISADNLGTFIQQYLPKGE